MKSLESYTSSLALNIKSNHPITVVYTDDPNDTLAITKAAIPTIRPKTDKIYYWNSRSRWSDITPRDKTLAELLANPSAVTLSTKQAKTPLEFAFSSPEELKCKNPIFIMSLISIQFKGDNMGIMQELRDFDYLVRHGVNESYRIVLIANSSFEIPSDYENIFGVVKHTNPIKTELEELYDEDFMKDFIQKVLTPMYDGKPADIEKVFKDLKQYCVNTLAGLPARQVKLILYKAVSHSAIRTNNSIITSIDVEKFKAFVYDKKFEEISHSGILELLQPTPIDQVGGLVNFKEWAKQRAWTFSAAAKTKNVERSKGCALIGPPGTGKTWLARSVASALDMPCIKFNAADVGNKYVGESEARMKQTLETVEAMAPCVLFIDEVDKVFASQAGGNHAGDSGTSSRVFGKLLSWMQDTKSEVFVIVTANRVQNIPSEFLRKGRLDEIWCVDFPTRTERKEIIEIHLKKRTYGLKNVENVLDKTEDFSSSEIEHIVKEGIIKAGFSNKPLAESHLLEAVKELNPSSNAFKEDIAYMKAWANNHARMASTPEVNKFAEKEQATI